jgi:hypothetical protein
MPSICRKWGSGVSGELWHIAISILHFAIIVKNWIWRVLMIVPITEDEASRVLCSASLKIPAEAFS